MRGKIIFKFFMLSYSLSLSLYFRCTNFNSRWLWVYVNFFQCTPKEMAHEMGGNNEWRKKEKEMLQNLKPFTKKKTNDVRKRQQQPQQKLCVRLIRANEQQQYKRNTRFGTCNCTGINRHKFSKQINTQTRARAHTYIDIHPTIIKTNDSTTGGEQHYKQNTHAHNTRLYILCASVKWLYTEKWLNIITRMTLQTSEECVFVFCSKFPFVLLLFEHKKPFGCLVSNTHLFIIFIFGYCLCVCMWVSA